MADQKKTFPEITKATSAQPGGLGLIYQDNAVFTAPHATLAAGFSNLAALTADTSLSYSNVSTGSVVVVGYDRYAVVASGTASPDVTTAGGVKLDLVAGGSGAYVPLAGGDMTGDLTRDGANIGLPEITTGNTSRSFALTDVGNLVTVDTTAGAVVLTMNPNATTALPLVSIIHIALTDSTSSLTITAGAGVTINGIAAGSAIVTSTDGSEVSLMKIATDEWLAVGNIGVFS